MLNFFGTNKVVPNGYIYTSGTGSKYVCLEGIWFNNETLKLVDPSKTEKMDAAATQQIMEHNKSAKTMIGESFDFAGKAYVYLGENRFIEDGVITENSIVSEVIADDQRTYKVSRDTLNREWNQIGFYIMPPHSEDIVIPAGFELNGFKFIPKVQRFIDMTTGKAPAPALERKLWDEANRSIRIINNSEDSKIFPIKSVLVQRNSNVRSEWNGKEFVDNEGNVIVPASKIPAYRKAYQEFINANPKDFPTLTTATQSNSERGVPQNNKYSVPTKQEPTMAESIMEAEGDQEFSNYVPGNPEDDTIPHRFDMGDHVYNSKKGLWQETNSGRMIEDERFTEKLNDEAREEIRKLNASSDIPVNSTINYKGTTLTWNGENWVGAGKVYGDKFAKKASEVISSGAAGSDVTASDTTTETTPNSEVTDTTTTVDEPKSETKNTDVPSGYQIKSKSGKTYAKKGTSWIDVSTKKPLNSSAAQSVERAAQAAIVKHNKTSAVKIGQEFKAKSGTVYKYVGGTNFVSEDGKKLAPSVAQGIMDRLWRESDEQAEKEKSEPEQTNEPQDVPQPEAQPEPTAEPQSEPTSEPSGEPQSDDPLSSIASRIKASPFAKKIRVLLTRGDAISLLAADIMLNGKRDEALQILKSLNNNDE